MIVDKKGQALTGAGGDRAAKNRLYLMESHCIFRRHILIHEGVELNPQLSRHGALFVWSWDDTAIEKPNDLKLTLDAIINHGFSGVLARLKQSRYPLLHPRVVRAVTQVSLWAKNRNLPFWFQADPRQSSRQLINQSGDCSQSLMYTQYNPESQMASAVNVCPIKDNAFNLVFSYPEYRTSSKLDDRALMFIPNSLERAFMFKMKNGKLQKKWLRDISSITNFFVNIPERQIEVFGHINTLGDDDWWVMAFPKFDLNLYDYAGRIANDAMYNFVEDLFDSGAYIDGITWDTAGYIMDIGRLPVSTSIYNSFLVEYGYDIRDFLYALVMDVDDGSHIRIRHDYHSLLMGLVYTAFKEFTTVGKSFLGGIDSATSHSWSFRTQPSLSLIQGDMDPWQGLNASSVGMTEMALDNSLTDQLPLVVSQLVATKSLATFSESKRAYLHLKIKDLNHWEYLFDLMAFYSVEPMIDSGQIQVHGSVFEFENHYDKSIEYINKRLESVREISRFALPMANTAIVYPIDTIMAVGHEKADHLIHQFHHCVAAFSLLGIQLDILSPGLLLKGSIKNGNLQIDHRYYECLLYPFPEIIRTDVLNTLSVFSAQGFSTCFGGSRPQFNILGERVPHTYPVHFDPADISKDTLSELGLKGLVKGLHNGMANLIHLGDTQVLLMIPAAPNLEMSGDLVCENARVKLEPTNRLVIFEIDLNGKITQRL